VNVPELVAVPPAVVTATVPVVPTPETTTSDVPLLLVIDATEVPPILTFVAVAPVRFVPVIVMVVPGQPEEGLIPEIVGTGGGVKVYVRPEVIAAVVLVVKIVVLATFVVETTD
jgi:hypothetical protein